MMRCVHAYLKSKNPGAFEIRMWYKDHIIVSIISFIFSYKDSPFNSKNAMLCFFIFQFFFKSYTLLPEYFLIHEPRSLRYEIEEGEERSFMAFIKHNEIIIK